MNILVDADVLVALAKKDDSNHQKAMAMAEKIKNANLFASVLAIPEAATVISHQVSQRAAVEFLLSAREKKITILPLTAEVEKLADEIFVSQKTKGSSWPDCLNMAILKKYALEAIFSFDKTYTRNGFQVLP